jgi:2-polyprenyl-3-methyl-5-hydroxy-6-metoxy-1,4-benzoquinol methylase
MTTFTLNDLEFEYASCLICGSSETVPAGAINWRKTELRYVLCKRCGLKYMKPRLTQAWYEKFYEEEFWQEKIVNKAFSRRKKPRRKAELGMQKKITKQLSIAEQVLRIVSSAKQLTGDHLVLEIGASWGVTLDLLHRRTGCQVLAVEPSEIARAYVQDKFGISIIGQVMEHLYEPQSIDGKVDLVIFSHVLENIVDPLEALERTHSLLASSGLVYVDTCNFYYNDAMNPYHPYIFGPETLKALMGKAGFEVVSVFCEDHPRVAVKPSNRYLTILAQKGQFVEDIPQINVEKLSKDQKLGLELVKKSRSDNSETRGFMDKLVKKIKAR